MKKTFKKKEGRRIKRKRKTLKRRGGEGEKNSFFSKITNKASDFSAYAKDSMQASLPILRNRGPNRVGDDGFSFVEPRPSLERVIHLGAMPDQTKESLQGKKIDEIILKLKAESNDYLFNREMKLLDRDQIKELPNDIIVRWLEYIISDTDNKSVRKDYTDAIRKISPKQFDKLGPKFLLMETRLDNRFGGKSRTNRKQKRTLKRGRR